ncbi:MAG: DotU family type IV/VI secretion system protein [Myxococcota bacterium]
MTEWSAITPVLDEIDALCREDGMHGTQAETAIARDRIKTGLSAMRSRLSQLVGPPDVREIEFVVIVVSDERLHQVLGKRGVAWSPLQRELLGIEEGGDLFFERVQIYLHDPATHPFLYTLCAYMLQSGFRGRYLSRDDVIDGLHRSLASRVGRPEPLDSRSNKGALPHALDEEIPHIDRRVSEPRVMGAEPRGIGAQPRGMGAESRQHRHQSGRTKRPMRTYLAATVVLLVAALLLLSLSQ